MILSDAVKTYVTRTTEEPRRFMITLLLGPKIRFEKYTIFIKRPRYSSLGTVIYAVSRHSR